MVPESSSGPREGVRITSEIGPLETVLCHTPGPELGVVTPSNRESYLFNDLLDQDKAARQHGRMRAILERFAEVYEISDLLEEVFDVPEARRYLLEHRPDVTGEKSPDLAPEEWVRVFIEGEESSGGTLASLLNEAGYTLPPLPNLFFLRDPAVVIGDRVVVAAMQHEVRWTEEVILRALFSHHPLLSNGGILYDGADERRMNTSIEGGDVHVLREDVVAVGMSERTSAAGIDTLRRALFSRTDVTELLVVLMPRHRTSIHLDMIFTMVDRELACAYAPYFRGPKRLPTLHLRASEEGVREKADLFEALGDVGMDLSPIYCGGGGRTVQEREQWASGCNLFAVEPGTALAYDRNEHTLSAMEEAGFRAVDGVEFLTGDTEIGGDERAVITFEGSELVRGGGGPRCMTLPVRRGPVAW
ncbi:MAG: arginine deiminase family protein [Gemmatimonadota bacterium]